MKNFLKERWLFLQQLRHNPRAIGAIFPSSHSLANAMVQQIPKETKGLIVELGAGTGAITQYLQTKFPADQLLILERSPKMVELLKNKFPAISIMLGDAVELSNLVKPFLKPVDVIISSLPLRSMAAVTLEKIEASILDVLTPQGTYIQFTYDFRNNAAIILPRLNYLYSKKVWLNFPPARVDVYTSYRTAFPL